jgi:hypothetical protein
MSEIEKGRYFSTAKKRLLISPIAGKFTVFR